MEFDKKILSFLNPDLVDKILQESSIIEFPKGTEILREQQYVKVLPIVIMSHNQIASELGTAREVITRVLKKLGTDGKVVQNAGEIRIIGEW